MGHFPSDELCVKAYSDYPNAIKVCEENVAFMGPANIYIFRNVPCGVQERNRVSPHLSRKRWDIGFDLAVTQEHAPYIFPDPIINELQASVSGVKFTSFIWSPRFENLDGKYFLLTVTTDFVVCLWMNSPQDSDRKWKNVGYISEILRRYYDSTWDKSFGTEPRLPPEAVNNFF